ncbi:hypothetical protein OUZ56_012149 [Daphnia magna]|uniref:Uncharacterized protein n=1 Tax=Daphnia magna TaxID=35525 RepID=A0ABQ9Z259_9CRUS|nr:hypothetical protein OUZ56_012149 [Daphnia magna]
MLGLKFSGLHLEFVLPSEEWYNTQDQPLLAPDIVDYGTFTIRSNNHKSSQPAWILNKIS